MNLTIEQFKKEVLEEISPKAEHKLLKEFLNENLTKLYEDYKNDKCEVSVYEQFYNWKKNRNK